MVVELLMSKIVAGWRPKLLRIGPIVVLACLKCECKHDKKANLQYTIQDNTLPWFKALC